MPQLVATYSARENVTNHQLGDGTVKMFATMFLSVSWRAMRKIGVMFFAIAVLVTTAALSLVKIRDDPGHATDRNVPGATTGPERNSLKAP
jgi:hypothetical protein